MAELRSTDIIGKLRKINNRLQAVEGKINGDIDIASTGTMTTSYVKNLTTNINGLQNSDFTLSEQYSGGFLGKHYYKVLYKQNSVMTRANASMFIGFLTGSKFVPSLLANNPQYHYIITYQNDVYLIGFTLNRELELHKVPLDDVKINISTNIETDADSDTIVPSVKAVKDYVDNHSPSEVFIGSQQPIGESYQIWVQTGE